MKFFRLCIAVLILLSVIETPALARENHEISNELDNMVNSVIEAGNAKGAVLSIVKDGDTILCKGYGFADEFHNIAADGEKIAFRIGSVSKTFVAVAVQILHQEGHLDLNCDISTYLPPDFPPFSYPVNMYQLLTHTAGFEETVTGMAVYNISDTEPLAESIRNYVPAQAFKPGEVISYSNYGIALAAYVVECITNQSFAQYCRERIFLPLDMNHTTFEHMQDTAYVSKPYLPDGSETLEPYMNLYPEGSAVSTAEDMAKYMQWLLEEQDTRILSTTSKKELFLRQFSMSEDLEGIGYVWSRKTRNNKLYYDKKGETLHFYTRIALYPEQQTGIFLSFNTYLPEDKINAIMKKATDLLYGESHLTDFRSNVENLDINGLYVNNWSSNNTPEKILRYLIPGKTLNIRREADETYSIHGEKMTLIGENLYASSIGILKFQEKGGKTFISTESAITYSKVSWWHHRNVQILIPLLFFVSILTCFLRELSLIVRRRKKEYNIIPLAISLIQIISFFALCLLIYLGIIRFSLLMFVLPMKICGCIILSACTTETAYLIRIRSTDFRIKLIPICANLAGLLFCLWMFWFHIL
ncbi:MAG: serine hydrolase [Herbinix sp.]|nr:serine hydrolase [Herbinix sp.]